MNVKIIYGPPGTGKTTTLQNILAEEVKHYGLNEIAYVSFTKEGARQGSARACEALGVKGEELPYFRTLHSIAYRSLELAHGDVISKSDYRLFSEKMGMHFTGYYTEDLQHNDDRYLFFDGLHRNNPRTAQNYIDELDTRKLAHVRRQYTRFKEHTGVYDFTDMVEQFIARNESLPVKVAFIDEAQDLTTLQWEMIWVAFRDCEKVYIAGDDDQAIYEWSGADVQYFLKLEGEKEILKQSYRLPSKVLRFAKRISNLIVNRIPKNFEGTGDGGNVLRIGSLADINIDNGESWLFLSRNVCFLKPIVQHLREDGYPHTYRKKQAINTNKVETINLFEGVRRRHQITDAERIKLNPHLYNGEMDITAPWFDNFKWPEDELIFYRDVIAKGHGLNNGRINVDTIHSVKGGEADNVVLLTDITRLVSQNLHNNPDSEHRVFYVGATRARKNLYVVDPMSYNEYPFLINQF